MIVHTLGTVPYGRVCHSGAYLTAKSFTPDRGTAPVCLEHWHGGDYVFRFPAYFAPGANGVHVLHRLDTSLPEEAVVADLVAAGRLKWSHGMHATAEAQRAAEAVFYRDVAPRRAYTVHALNYGRVGHWAYTSTPAFAQDPIVVMATVRGTSQGVAQ